MTYDELIEVLRAAKAGKTIQSPTFCSNGEYADVTDFAMQVDNLKFRVKPEPREIWLRDSEIPDYMGTSTVYRIVAMEKDCKPNTAKLVKFAEVLE